MQLLAISFWLLADPAVPDFMATLRGSALQSLEIFFHNFKEREDEASQLNRLGELELTPILLIDYLANISSAPVVSTFVVSPVQFLTRTEDAIELSNSFELKADSQVLTAVTAPSKFYGQAERAISTGKLHALLRFNILPINQVVYLGPSLPLRVGRSHLEECFPLICIQRLSQPNFATERCHWHDNSITRGSSIPVLSY